MTEENNTFDVVVVGGGVNGTGIAMDAAGRGLKVLLCEMNDLASATSSSSSKLIHGGLRYLEHYEFRLVREALAERESLLRNSPHIMWPMRFRLPHRPHLRPAWMIRTGLFLYDHLAKREGGGNSRTQRLFVLWIHLNGPLTGRSGLLIVAHPHQCLTVLYVRIGPLCIRPGGLFHGRHGIRMFCLLEQCCALLQVHLGLHKGDDGIRYIYIMT